MTVAALPTSIDYLEDGTSLEFAVPFRFDDPTNIVAQRELAGVFTSLAYGSAYSVTGGATDAGGTLTLASTVAGAKLHIWRETARSQVSDYETNDIFPAATLEGNVDKITLMVQENAREIGRAPKFPRGETAADIQPLAARQGNVAAWTAAGALASFTPGALASFVATALIDVLPSTFKGNPGGDASQVGTLTEARGMDIAASIKKITTVGYASETRKLPVEWIRVASQPSHGFKFQDHAGAWWEGNATRGVPVWAFGACGESLNEGAALQAAYTAAMAMGSKAIHDPQATYVLNPFAQGGNGVTVVPQDGQSLEIDGCGATLKFADNLATSGTTPFGIYVLMRATFGVSNARAKRVCIHGFTIDGNARAQAAPGGVHNDWIGGTAYSVGDVVYLTDLAIQYGSNLDSNANTGVVVKCITANSDAAYDGSKWTNIGYNFEQRAMLKVQALAVDSNYIELVEIYDIRSVDPLADGIQVAPSDVNGATVGVFNFWNIHEERRNMTRAMVIWGSAVLQVNGSRCTAGTRGKYPSNIETEFSQMGSQTCTASLSDCEMDGIELASKDWTTAPRFTVKLSNVSTRHHFTMGYGNIEAVNCTLRMGRTGSLGVTSSQRMYRSAATNCLFLHPVYYKSGSFQVRQLNHVPDTSGGSPAFVKETGCRHLIEPTDIASAPTGTDKLVRISSSANGNLGTQRYQFNACSFDEAAPGSINNNAGGSVVTRGCSFGGTDIAVETGVLTNFAGEWTSVGDDYSKVTGTSAKVSCSVSGGYGANVVFIEPRGLASFAYTVSGTFYADILGYSSRKRFVSAAPSGAGIAGDTAQLTSAAYSSAATGGTIPVEWRCFLTHSSSATWTALRFKP